MQDRSRTFGSIRKDLATKIEPDLLRRMGMSTRATIQRFAPPDMQISVSVTGQKASVHSTGKVPLEQLDQYVGAYKRTAELLQTRQDFDRVMAIFGVA